MTTPQGRQDPGAPTSPGSPGGLDGRPRPTRVQLFATCLVDHLFPAVADAAVRLLERAGLEVTVPVRQTCCGQPAFNGGFLTEARRMARHTVRVLAADPAPIVVPSGSCAHMIAHQYPELLAEDEELKDRARDVASRTFELTEFLVEVLGIRDTGASASGCLTFHASCHTLRGLGVQHPPLALLREVKGGTLRELPSAETCCGFGGLFSVKMPELSMAMLDEKIASIEACGVDTIVATDVSCLMHIGGALHRRGSLIQAAHIAEVLAGTTPEAREAAMAARETPARTASPEDPAAPLSGATAPGHASTHAAEFGQAARCAPAHESAHETSTRLAAAAHAAKRPVASHGAAPTPAVAPGQDGAAQPPALDCTTAAEQAAGSEPAADADQAPDHHPACANAMQPAASTHATPSAPAPSSSQPASRHARSASTSTSSRWHRPRAVGFRARASEALADTRLRAALKLTTTRLFEARAAAISALPGADDLRDRARKVRLHTLARLDRYLEQFVAAAERAGARVHWAESAEQANRIVAGLARTRGISTAVKSKSMVTEEIGLNEALAQAGVRVVETDLGEWVVQLGEDRPSHIITPIIHKSRGEVAALFREKLGAGADEVAGIPEMTALARRRLRAEFLDAGMGISGANFLVAETGSLCLVTNEGNGRMCTSVPRVHVAVAGIERLVPTVSDLALMLQLLPRSATGQRLSAYTSIVTGPRRKDEPDGPDELHIVLVDNGRSRILGSDIAEILACIRCGACLNACPVYRHAGGHAYDSVYPGPVGSVFTPGLGGINRCADLPHASSLCGACRDVCPVGIDIPRLLLRLRAQTVQAHHAEWWLRAGLSTFSFAAARPWLFRLAATTLARVSKEASTDGWLSHLPGPLAAWTRGRDFPALAERSFCESWWHTRGRRSRRP